MKGIRGYLFGTLGLLINSGYSLEVMPNGELTATKLVYDDEPIRYGNGYRINEDKLKKPIDYQFVPPRKHIRVKKRKEVKNKDLIIF